MNNAAVYTTARIAEFRRADLVRQAEAARNARIARRTRSTSEPTVTEVPPRRRSGWSRWIPAPRPAV